jgi:hypothetical protein
VYAPFVAGVTKAFWEKVISISEVEVESAVPIFRIRIPVYEIPPRYAFQPVTVLPPILMLEIPQEARLSSVAAPYAGQVLISDQLLPFLEAPTEM